jgi:hypothetical protein
MIANAMERPLCLQPISDTGKQQAPNERGGAGPRHREMARPFKHAESRGARGEQHADIFEATVGLGRDSV